MPRRSSPSPPPGKRRRLDRSRANDDDDDDEPSAAATTTTTALSAFVHPTTVIKAKTKGKGRADHDFAPLCAFPRISTYEATDRPRRARRLAFKRASAWLSRYFALKATEAATSLADDVAEWILRIRTADAAPLSHALQRDLPVAALASALPGSQDGLGLDVHAILARLRAQHEELTSPGNALWTTLDAAQAGGSPRSLLATCCQSWLRQVDEALGVGAGTSLGPGSGTGTGAIPLWNALCRRYRDLGDSPPLLVLVLPALPRPALWETLHYLINAPAPTPDDVDGPHAAPRIAVLLHSGTGPAGIDSIETAHRRLLDLTVFAPATETQAKQDPRVVVEELFRPRNGQEPLPIRVPPSVARYCALAAQGCADDAASPAQGLQRWLELSIQHYLTHDPTSVLGCEQGRLLRAEDFTPAFFAQLRHALLSTLGGLGGGEPAIHLLPHQLRSRASLRRLLTEDQFLLEHSGAFLSLEQAQARARLLGLELLGLLDEHAKAGAGAGASAAPASTLDTATRFALLFPSALAAHAERFALRKRINDLMAPSLRSVRRSESEGGLGVPQLEAWLDRIEDWAGGSEEEGSAALQTLLADVRSLQQKLLLARDSGSNTGAGAGAGASADGPPGGKLTRVQLVERKLKLEEELRGLRREIADWFGGAVRGMLLGDVAGGGAADVHGSTPPSLFDARREEAEAQFRAAAVESLLSPSPRSHITLALGRPHVYLEAFAASLRADAAQAPEHAKLRAELDTYFTAAHAEESAQTDLSVAYNLLREAGGGGTGVKGRLVNVFDWYHAWQLGVQAGSRARARAKSKARGDAGPVHLQAEDDHEHGHEHEAGQMTPRASAKTNGRSGPPPKKRGRGRPPRSRPASDSDSDDGDGDGDGDGVSTASGRASLQARFALALSTLALLGYIKKTRKGRRVAVSAAGTDGGGGHNGTGGALGGEVYVLKVGGWDVLPGVVE